MDYVSFKGNHVYNIIEALLLSQKSAAPSERALDIAGVHMYSAGRMDRRTLKGKFFPLTLFFKREAVWSFQYC